MSRKRQIVRWFRKLKRNSFESGEDLNAPAMPRYGAVDGERYLDLGALEFGRFDEIDRTKETRLRS